MNVQAMLQADTPPRLAQRQCWRNGLAFHLIYAAPDGREYTKASGPLGFVARVYRETRNAPTQS